MNTDHQRPGPARNEAEDLLAASADWDLLPPTRHRLLKESLMRQLDHDPHTPESAPAPVPARRRLPRPALALPAAALALAGVLAVTLTGGENGPAPAVGAQPRTGTAHVTLDRIAAAAARTDAVPVREDQFVYVERLARENKGDFGGPVKLGAAHRAESWTAQRPEPVTVTGWLRASGQDAVMPGQLIPVTSGDAEGPGLRRPTYAWLAALPGDPDALLDRLRAQITVAEGDSEDQAVFGAIGDLLSGSLLPPGTAAALYRALAEIPGITWVPDAVDAAGRHGIGITHEAEGSATRSVLIFDEESLVYLGSQQYFVDVAGASGASGASEGAGGPGGSGGSGGSGASGSSGDELFGTDAVMARGVVDRQGETPTGPTAP
ncbi:CU044_5270 family protein [Streptomyces sp. NPDC048290]|uniref:CU044_5270 family protein n=1 Tax=Streptomyces sp. NPDC048290 TaxID=3155811 RepID=UPI003443696D